MARINYVKAAQQRYVMVPKTDDEGQQVVSPVMRRNGTAKVTKRGREVTRRASIEDRSQPKPMPTCGKCGKTIEVGQPYKWVKTKSGPYGGAKLIRCATCPTWKQSELSSSKMAGVYAAEEQCDEQLGECNEVGDLEALRDDLADQIESVADEYQESAENMVSGFGHETSTSDDIQQKADDLREWAESIRGIDFDEFEGDDEAECEGCGGTGKIELEREEGVEPEEGDDDCPDCDGTGKADVEEARETWIEEQRDKLSDEMGNCP